MEGEDEIVFLGKFRDFDLNVRYAVGGKNETDVAFALASINAKIEDFAYKFSEIDCKKVQQIANPKGTGLQAVVDFLSSNKPNDLRSQLMGACTKNEKLISVAESYFFNQLFEKAKVSYKLTPEMLNVSLKPETQKPIEQVVFVGKYKTWISIKKLSLDKTTEDWEVSGILAGINNTLIAKAFDFVKASGNPVSVVGRKSYGNVAEALKKLVLSGNKINDAFALSKTMEGLGYKPYAGPDMLSDAHPEIKGVKLKGRKQKS